MADNAIIQIVAGSELKICEGGAHGLATVEQDRFNADLLAFARAEALVAA